MISYRLNCVFFVESGDRIAKYTADEMRKILQAFLDKCPENYIMYELITSMCIPLVIMFTP